MLKITKTNTRIECCNVAETNTKLQSIVLQDLYNLQETLYGATQGLAQ